ncbi:MAG: PH domain-containing protein [Candidatus Moraniibacteriota bacterium]
MQQLDSRAVWIFLLNYIGLLLIPMMMWIFLGSAFYADLGGGVENSAISFGFLNWLWILIPIIIIACYVWAKLTYHYYRYELTDTGFRKESGVIYKKYVTIPYDRIQNVDIYRGILARIFGLSDLQVQTAGASAVVSRYGMTGVGAEGRLPGLSREIAEQLRDELIRRARQPKNQGL